MQKVTKISGFPEWLPEEKLIEERLIQTVKQIYELHGFTPIETPAVELISSLSNQGVIEKEIFAVRRAKADEQSEAELGLHFDLTIPFARYTALHFNDLVFPFKRYQLQKVWRGERPQKGRFREFYQFDIDIICRDELPIAADAEVVAVVEKIFSTINLGKFQLKINNRKILHGFYRALGLDEKQRKATIVIVDKIAKIGKAGVAAELDKVLAGNNTAIEKIVKLAELKASPANLSQVLDSLAVDDSVFAEGREELLSLISLLPAAALSNIQIDLSLARGLDYYTGLILEVIMLEYPEFGSVCGGGRYADLASQFINQKLPGVGVSFGLTRFMELVLDKKLLEATQKTTTKVLVAVYSEAQRMKCLELAEKLRAAGAPTEVFYTSPKLGKQIDYAAKKGISFIAFINELDGSLEIKNLLTKEQCKVADLSEWCRGLIGRAI